MNTINLRTAHQYDAQDVFDTVNAMNTFECLQFLAHNDPNGIYLDALGAQSDEGQAHMTEAEVKTTVMRVMWENQIQPVSTPNFILKAVKIIGFDDAIKAIQDALCIETGDMAGVFFSGEEYEDIEERWTMLTMAERLELIVKYTVWEIELLTDEDIE